MASRTSGKLNMGRVASILPVSDIQKSYQLYASMFGFRKAFENGDPVGFMILKKDEAEIHLSLQPGYKAPKFNVAHMLVSDADAAYEACLRHGLRIIKRLQNKDYGLRAFVFEDADGNRIDVGEPM